jgi:hypothetical protein
VNRTLNIKVNTAHPNNAQLVHEIHKEEQIDIFNLKRVLSVNFRVNKILQQKKDFG